MARARDAWNADVRQRGAHRKKPEKACRLAARYHDRASTPTSGRDAPTRRRRAADGSKIQTAGTKPAASG